MLAVPSLSVVVGTGIGILDAVYIAYVADAAASTVGAVGIGKS